MRFVVRWLALFLSLAPLEAAVARVEIERRSAVLEGRAFGRWGAYEKLSGHILFQFDPANPRNARIVDLDRAPRNARGRVEARANFMVLQPRDPALRRGLALLEASNRGHKVALRYFNRARSSLDPKEAEDFGDGLLMRLGLTLVWVGWQFDVPANPDLLRLEIPVAGTPQTPILGLVRSDWTVDKTTRTLSLGHRGHWAYPVLDPKSASNVLTVREGRLAPRRVVPRREWRFARLEGETVLEDRTHIFRASGFQAGKIYELVYGARDPRLVGLGLAVIRDTASALRYNPSIAFPAQRVLGFGVSQTGRFLRHFLYQGFATDEAGRPVFDGLLIHTAGAGRGSFNHRFAQPSRDAHRYSAFFYPTDLFPFTGRLQTDPLTGRRDGLLAHAFDPRHLPRIFYTNTGYDYWGRAAALIHMSVDGSRDVQPLPRVRIYHLAGAQHFVGRFPPRSRLPGSHAYRGNPLDFLPTLRALLVRMLEWVEEGKAPPRSRYPTLKAGTLVPIDQLRFPTLPGLERPHLAQEAYRAHYGPRFRRGIIDFQPPHLGSAFPVRVPQVDGLGNELSGIRGRELQVPLATYAPWNLRTGYPGATDELTDFLGTYIPLPPSERERLEWGDPRPSLEMLYRNREDFLKQSRQALRRLMEEGFLLGEDGPQALVRAAAEWDWIHSSGR